MLKATLQRKFPIDYSIYGDDFINRKSGRIVLKTAQYRTVKSLDHKQGNGYPKSPLDTIFFVCQDRFGTANSLLKIKKSPPCLRLLSFVYDILTIIRNNLIEISCWKIAITKQKSHPHLAYLRL